MLATQQTHRLQHDSSIKYRSHSLHEETVMGRRYINQANNSGDKAHATVRLYIAL
jgi:hypothetical protein